MTKNTRDMIETKLIEAGNSFERLEKKKDIYGIYMTTTKLGYFLSAIDRALMTDKITLDEHGKYFKWYSIMSNNVLEIALELDNKIYDERRIHEAEQ